MHVHNIPSLSSSPTSSVSMAPPVGYESLKLNGNKAAVLVKQHQLLIQPFPFPNAPKSNEVIVKMKALGICGSDVHYWTHGAIGDFVVRQPMVIGHESAGEVVCIGSSVTHLKVGDRVALEPGLPCRHCNYCKAGNYNLCPDMAFFSTPPVHGSLANYVCHSADFCHKLPHNMSFEQGAMCEPLSVGVYACQRGQIKPGDKVAILGAGPIGLVTMLVAKAFGATYVVMTDVQNDRLEVSRKLGANLTVNVSKQTPQQLKDHIVEAIGSQVDVTFDCCGYESASHLALLLTRSGGNVCIIGMHDNTMSLPVLPHCVIREVDLCGIFRYRNTYPTCINLITNNKVNVNPLITHRISISLDNNSNDSVNQANLIKGFELAKNCSDGAIKIMFNLS